MSAEIGTGRWPDSKYKEGYGPAEFCEEHGLIRPLVPFSHLTINPWDTVERLHDGIEALPTTAATFELPNLYDDRSTLQSETPEVMHLGLRLLGAWPFNQDRKQSTRWVNPNYPHQGALAPADVESRMDVVRECADLGLFDLSELATRFDMGDRTLREWIEEEPFTYRERRKRGRERIARTVAVAAEWIGCARADLTRLLPVKKHTIGCWIRKSVTHSDWEIPADPSSPGWSGDA